MSMSDDEDSIAWVTPPSEANPVNPTKPSFSLRIQTKEFDFGYSIGVMLEKCNGARRAWKIGYCDTPAFVAEVLRDMARWAEKVPEA